MTIHQKRSSRARPAGGLMGAAVIVSLLALLPTACMVGPDYVEPEAPVAPSWLESGDPRVSSGAADHADWWKGFQDPVLDLLIERAYHQNLDLLDAGLRVLQARAQLGIAVGEAYPQVQQFSAGYTRQEGSENVADPLSQRAIDNYSLGLDASWELDFWGQFARNTRSANAALMSTMASYDSVLVSLTGEVAMAYVMIRALEERTHLARQDITSQESVLELTQIQFDNGSASELDVAQSQSRLSQSQALVPQLEIDLRKVKNALCLLLGEPPRALDDLLAGDIGLPRAPEQVAVGMPADLLLRRPDVRAAERAAAAQAERIGIAEANLYPHFGITASGGWASESTGNLLSRPSWDAAAGAGFQWDIFNYGRLKNDVRVQDALFQQAVVQYQQLVLRAAEEVENGLVGFLKERDREGFLEAGVAASQRALDISVIQYREGEASYSRVLDAQTSLFDLQQDLVVSKSSGLISLIGIYKALGGGWQLREGHDFVPAKTREEMAERTDWGDMLGAGYQEGTDLLHERPDPNELYPSDDEEAAGTQP